MTTTGPPRTPTVPPGRARRGLLDAPGHAVRSLGRLVVPVACPGCGTPDVRWCAACAAPFAGGPDIGAPGGGVPGGGVRRVERSAPRLDRLDDAGPLPVWALARYEGPVRGLVVAWKDRDRVDLDALLVPALRRGAAAVGEVLRDVAGPGRGPGGRLGGCPGGVRVLVVPVPTTAAARRARGRAPVVVLAAGVAAGLRDAGLDARVAPLLRRRAARDQVGLGARARGRNAAGLVLRDAVARRLLRASPPAAGAPARGPALCLLVDDVLTTGATLAACERALARAGADPVGALVLAATPPPAGTAGGAGHDVGPT